VTEDQLRTLAASVGHPVFWLGPRDGYTYELTRTSNGSIYVRYLPSGEDVGTKKTYLTVATYPFSGAFPAIQKVAKQKGITSLKLAHGGIAETSKADPSSVHAAYPGVDYQVEVYDPTPGTATGLVTTGQLAALGGLKGTGTTPTTQSTEPTAASPAELRSLASSLDHPIYWIGKKKGYTYELTRTTDDQVYLRYLPPGVPVGTKGQYFTVATYPFAGAFAAILKVAKDQNTPGIALDNGGRAIVDAGNPKSVHLAFPGSDYQIEVFDPSPARARRIVAAGRLKNVG
jgi:hypothetical protein